jgi:hypothetical protein
MTFIAKKYNTGKLANRARMSLESEDAVGDEGYNLGTRMRSDTF